MCINRTPTPLNPAVRSPSGVGQPAGGVASRVSGFFIHFLCWLVLPSQVGRQADMTTLKPKYPRATNDGTFHCPEWPTCGCPGGTMRPECPGLKERRDAQ